MVHGTELKGTQLLRSLVTIRQQKTSVDLSIHILQRTEIVNNLKKEREYTMMGSAGIIFCRSLNLPTKDLLLYKKDVILAMKFFQLIA